MIDLRPFYGSRVLLKIKGQSKEHKGDLLFKEKEGVVVLKELITSDGEEKTNELTIDVKYVAYIGYLD